MKYLNTANLYLYLNWEKSYGTKVIRETHVVCTKLPEHRSYANERSMFLFKDVKLPTRVLFV